MDRDQLNDIVYKIAKRAKELADLSTRSLKLEAGYGTTTKSEALQMAKGKSRGTLVEEIITEEFHID